MFMRDVTIQVHRGQYICSDRLYRMVGGFIRMGAGKENCLELHRKMYEVFKSDVRSESAYLRID